MNLVERDIAARVQSLAKWTDDLSPEEKYGETPDLIEAVRETVSRLVADIASQRALTRLRHIVAAERVASVFTSIRQQRQTVDTQILLLADACAQDGYRRVLQMALSLGAIPEDLPRWPSPVIALEAMSSPVTFVRGRSARSPGFLESNDVSLPFPIVLIPSYADVSISALTIIHHELGHNVDEDFGLTPALRPAIDAALRRAGLPSDDCAKWTDWCREVVADVIGLFLAGSPLVAEMADWAALMPASRSTTHPPTIARVFLLELVLRHLGVTDPAYERVPSTASVDDDESLERALPIVLHALLHTPVPAISNHRLADLAPPLEDQESLLRRCQSLADDVMRDLPVRLIPSAARLASMRGVPNVEERIRAVLSGRPRATSAPFRFASFRQKVLATVDAPILADEDEGLKRPPRDLFDQVQTVTFVGASNDGLPMLFDAFRKRGLRRKALIEVFFLDEAAIRRMANARRDAATYVRDRRRAIDALEPGLLDAIAEQWIVREFDEPFVFAAYWDADRPGGRIHVSPHAWGQDVSRAPAFDYVWPLRVPTASRSYRFYLDALPALRSRATTVIARSR